MAVTIRSFIIALMFAITCMLVVLTMMFGMYASYGYNIDLSEDNYTAVLSDLQDQAETARGEVEGTSENMWDKTVGQVDSTIESRAVTEGEMIKNSIKALTNVGAYVQTLVTMISVLFSAIGISTAGAVFWFLTSSIVLTVSLILLSSVLRTQI